ncbi:MAG: hypothetical protein WCG96_10645 [Actinomycetes bacterium]
MSTLHLHLPDEPTGLAEQWLDDVVDGQSLESVLLGESGLAAWLWRRWSTVADHGLTREDLESIVVASSRELWLWLAGERVWSQACSGLLGRVERRVVVVEYIESRS